MFSAHAASQFTQSLQLFVRSLSFFSILYAEIGAVSDTSGKTILSLFDSFLRHDLSSGPYEPDPDRA